MKSCYETALEKLDERLTVEKRAIEGKVVIISKDLFAVKPKPDRLNLIPSKRIYNWRRSQRTRFGGQRRYYIF